MCNIGLCGASVCTATAKLLNKGIIQICCSTDSFLSSDFYMKGERIKARQLFLRRAHTMEFGRNHAPVVSVERITSHRR